MRDNRSFNSKMPPTAQRITLLENLRVKNHNKHIPQLEALSVMEVKYALPWSLWILNFRTLQLYRILPRPCGIKFCTHNIVYLKKTQMFSKLYKHQDPTLGSIPGNKWKSAWQSRVEQICINHLQHCWLCGIVTNTNTALSLLLRGH